PKFIAAPGLEDFEGNVTGAKHEETPTNAEENLDIPISQGHDVATVLNHSEQLASLHMGNADTDDIGNFSTDDELQDDKAVAITAEEETSSQLHDSLEYNENDEHSD